MATAGNWLPAVAAATLRRRIHMLITGSSGSSVNNIIHVRITVYDHEHRVLYPRRPLLTHVTLPILDPWLFVTRAEEKWVPLLCPYLLEHHCFLRLDNHSDIPKGVFLGDS